MPFSKPFIALAFALVVGLSGMAEFAHSTGYAAGNTQVAAAGSFDAEGNIVVEERFSFFSPRTWRSFFTTSNPLRAMRTFFSRTEVAPITDVEIYSDAVVDYDLDRPLPVRGATGVSGTLQGRRPAPGTALVSTTSARYMNNTDGVNGARGADGAVIDLPANVRYEWEGKVIEMQGGGTSGSQGTIMIQGYGSIPARGAPGATGTAVPPRPADAPATWTTTDAAAGVSYDYDDYQSGDWSGEDVSYGQPGQPGQSSPPPPEAINACASKMLNGECSFQSPYGEVDGTCEVPPNANILACMP